jgi:lipoprotein signal peptidase
MATTKLNFEAASVAARRESSWTSTGWWLGVGAAVVAADQALKAYCKHLFINNQSARLIPGFDGIHLTRVMNPGLMFHAFSGVPRGQNEIYIRYFPTLALVLFFAFFLGTRGLGSSRRERFGFGLMLAGGLSNVVDHWRSYSVMDTLKVIVGGHYRYQAFNLADAAIALGLVLVLSVMLSELVRSFRPT